MAGRSALSNLLRQRDDDGYLIYQLVVEGAEPASVAAERALSRATLVEQLREAVDVLVLHGEDVAYASIGEGEQERARSAKAKALAPTRR